MEYTVDEINNAKKLLIKDAKKLTLISLAVGLSSGLITGHVLRKRNVGKAWMIVGGIGVGIIGFVGCYDILANSYVGEMTAAALIIKNSEPSATN